MNWYLLGWKFNFFLIFYSILAKNYQYEFEQEAVN